MVLHNYLKALSFVVAILILAAILSEGQQATPNPNPQARCPCQNRHEDCR